MQYMHLSQHFFPNKEKSSALNTLIRSSKLGWMNAADGMSLPVSDHFAKQSQICFLLSLMRELIQNIRRTPKLKQIYEVVVVSAPLGLTTETFHVLLFKERLH